MRYIKTYEDINDRPKVGNYVLMRTDSKNIEYNNFIRNTPGVIVTISNTLVVVKYENIPIKLIKLNLFEWTPRGEFYYHIFNINKMLVFSETPDNLEIEIDTNKYNL